MDVEHALSKAILDEPEDLPRLAYADWLDERGGEADAGRAEFIRVQLEQTRLRNAPAEPNERVVELWQAHRTDWFGPAAERLSLSECVRGFLTGVTVGTFVALVGEADRAGEAWPMGPVPVVRVGGRVWEGFDESVDHAAVARLPGLASWGGIDCQTECRELLKSPRLDNLRSLALARNSIGPLDLAPMQKAAFRLRSLRLSGWLQNDALHLLARDPAFGELRDCVLAARPETQTPAVEFLGSANVAHLRRLTLGSSGWVGKATLRAMLYSPRLTNLRSLTLSWQPEALSKTGAGEMAGWPGLAGLSSLTLEGDVGLTDDGLRLLTQSPHVAGLRELTLSCPGLDYRLLTQSPHLGGLRRLRLGGSAVSESVKAALTARFGGRVTFDAG